MSRGRSMSAVLASSLVAAMAAFLLSTALAQGGAGRGGRHVHRSHTTSQPLTRWWGPPSDVRGMLNQVSVKNLETDVQTLAAFGTRQSLSSQTDPARGIGAAGNWLFGQLQSDAGASGGAMTVQRQSFTQPPSPNVPVPTVITNVVATLQGTDPSAASRVYVVSAHYDDRVTDLQDFTNDAPGADEDASGVAAVLELARVMATRPAKATLEFVLFDGEEQGLYGSSFFAQQAKSGGTNIQADLNLDTIGNSVGDNGISDPHTMRVYSEGVPLAASAPQIAAIQQSGGEDDSASRELARYLAETGPSSATRMGVDLVSRVDRLGRGGDQMSFDRQGYPAVRYTEANENYNHEDQNISVQNGVQFGDLPQFLDYGYLTRATRLVGSSLAALARAPEAPTGVAEHLGSVRSNTFELTWNANPESDVVGYQVVWRDSSDPTWTHVIPVGNVTGFTIPDLNKDSDLFGVRAVNSAGDLSPVAFPSIAVP
ncbi:MAG: M28 family metallopeptidase [Solirubrobacterales bacterium]|nr:M28 family metallopeptidase [Solirubrobacterales bacterium]